MHKIEKLLLISSEALANSKPFPTGLFESYGRIGRQLLSMLQLKNGYYAFESALHVFPACSDQDIINLEQWNSNTLWKDAYGGLVDGYLFFAEDVFGQQFGILDNAIHFVDTETGQSEEFAGDFEEWASKMLDEYEVHTGYPLAQEWQEKHGSLAIGHRLVPKIPFVCGGEYQLGNLHSGESVKAMRFRGDLAQQIKDLPDGTEIEFKVVE